MEPVDRETLTSRLLEPNFNARGVETALLRLVRAGWLRSDHRAAHDPRAEIGLARKRIAYFLDTKGKQYFEFTPEHLRERITKLRVLRGHDGWNLHHDMGVSRFRAYLMNAEQKGLCRLNWKRHVQFDIIDGTDVHHHRPDYMVYIDDKPLYIEYERKNKLSKSVRHAMRYWEAYDQQEIHAPVIFVAQHKGHLKLIREAIFEELGDKGNFFRFLSEDQYDLLNPDPQIIGILTADVVL